jgi:hypothetical protein
MSFPRDMLNPSNAHFPLECHRILELRPVSRFWRTRWCIVFELWLEVGAKVYTLLSDEVSEIAEPRHRKFVESAYSGLSALPAVIAGPVGGRVDCGSEASYMWWGNEAAILVLEEGPRNCTSTTTKMDRTIHNC